MFEKFTERARKVMSLARQEAQRLNSEFIGTEHILLGIIQEGGGVAAKVLKNLNVDLKRIRTEIEKLITPSTSPTVTLGQLPFSPRAKLSKKAYDNVVARWNELGFEGSAPAISVFEETEFPEKI